MQRQSLWGIIVAIALSGGGALLASEADELRKRAQALREEATALAERGNLEQAGRLEREAGELLEASERMATKSKGLVEAGERPGIEREVLQLKEHLQVLLAEEKNLRKARAPLNELAEMRKRITDTERELQALQARQAGPRKLPPEFPVPSDKSPAVKFPVDGLSAEKFKAASRRIHHLRVAAENLKLAEAHDLARQIMEKAAVMELEVRAQKDRLAVEFEKTLRRDQGPEFVSELKHEVERLRAEVAALRQQVDSR